MWRSPRHCQYKIDWACLLRTAGVLNDMKVFKGFHFEIVSTSAIPTHSFTYLPT